MWGPVSPVFAFSILRRRLLVSTRHSAIRADRQLAVALEPEGFENLLRHLGRDAALIALAAEFVLEPRVRFLRIFRLVLVIFIVGVALARLDHAVRDFLPQFGQLLFQLRAGFADLLL